MSDIYDDPELQPTTGFENDITFREVGDRGRGRITRITRIQTQHGKVAKYFLFDEEAGIERGMLAGAQDLWSQLHKLRPNVGDMLDVEMIGKDGQRYIFKVEVEGELPF